jgi:HNH endonuclease/NUMOD4 motif
MCNLLVYCIMEEKWKYIKDTNEMFMVSNTGKIKGCERYTPFRTGSRFVAEKIFKLSKNNSGYLTATLGLGNGVSRSILVHRVVAENFVSNDKNYFEVNHIDGDKGNNNYDNLEWTSRSENQKHAFAMGLNVSKKTKVYAKDKEGNLFTYNSILDASNRLKVHRSNIHKCFKHSHYRMKGYLFSKNPFG